MITVNHVHKLNIVQNVLIRPIQALLSFIMVSVITLALQKLTKYQIKRVKNVKIAMHHVKLVLMGHWLDVHLARSFILLNKLMLVLRLVSLRLGMFVFLCAERECLSILPPVNARFAKLIVNIVLMLNTVTYANKVQAL